jgi:hypothetical protein
MAAPIDHSEAATVAFLAFLRTEANLCEHRANTLRSQADQLANLYGVTQDLQDRYGESVARRSPRSCSPVWIFS